MQTFTTSHEQNSHCRLRQNGFTLIELMVVLAIGSLLVGLIPMALSKMYQGSQYRDTVRSIITDVRAAHALAVARGQPVVFELDLYSKKFGIRGQPMKSIPESIEIKTITGKFSESSESKLSEIVFLPEGGSTGGSIELIRSVGTGVRLKVDWLFGQLTQEPYSP